jgi:hypothetical protein
VKFIYFAISYDNPYSPLSFSLLPAPRSPLQAHVLATSDHFVYNVMTSESRVGNEPRKYKEVCEDERWIEGMRNELDSIEKKETWTLVDPPSGCRQGCLWGGPPACPVRPIDLRARLVRVKRALTGGHGKSDLPCPRWLPRGPPRHRGSGRKCVAGRGRNGAYGTSGADAMARTGCRALTLWATTGRRARTGRTDGRGRGLRKRFCRRGRKRQVRVCGRARFGQYSYVGADATAGIVMRART